ncbi:symmetrical bis(5'-nucleosyl)-tetraphosphatase [Aestuariibacter salexigens]|uniref:symmetrical bis(5'-nucleosyl)-tetraphosphatase n=1 Tax=Aestuariibacter salexigens TaxID=226010 RepID=UPI00041C856F|nr:symmetrical bis(5'-nucleosyl)-tetraphosphatase [Aestuariibacter salexigens]
MANLIIGDIQGCADGLFAVLEKAGFNPAVDKLWCVGDLVARGADSLLTLQYLYDLGDRFHTVLGNHDLHFLAVANGIKQAKASDKLGPLLRDKQLKRYVEWLRHMPLATMCTPSILLTHAGLYPKWSVEKAISLSGEIEQKLQGSSWKDLLRMMYGSEPTRWKDSLTDIKRARFIINAMTRMRFVDMEGNLNLSLKSSPAAAPAHLQPWFRIDNPQLQPDQRVIFGHWAALQGQTDSQQFIGLDTGYVWGNQMTVYIVEENRLVQANAVKKKA